MIRGGISRHNVALPWMKEEKGEKEREPKQQLDEEDEGWERATQAEFILWGRSQELRYVSGNWNIQPLRPSARLAMTRTSLVGPQRATLFQLKDKSGRGVSVCEWQSWPAQHVLLLKVVIYLTSSAFSCRIKKFSFLRLKPQPKMQTSAKFINPHPQIQFCFTSDEEDWGKHQVWMHSTSLWCAKVSLSGALSSSRWSFKSVPSSLLHCCIGQWVVRSSLLSQLFFL